MNWLCTFTMLLAVTQAPAPTARKATNNGASDGHTQNQAANSSKQPPGSSVPSDTEDSNSPNLKTEPDQHSSDYDQHTINITNSAPVPVAWGLREWVVWVGNIALAIVGVVGIIVAICTLCFIKTQAIEMRLQRIVLRKTLNAVKVQGRHMERQTEILANTARAWVSTEIRFSLRLPDYAEQGIPDISCMVVSFVNSGSSPAEMKGAEIIAILSEFHLPDTPIYISEQISSIAGEVIGPGLKAIACIPIRFCDRLTPDDMKEIAEGNKHLYCYGFAEYTDNSGQGRKTQFGYYWYSRKGPNDSRPTGMCRMQDRAYNFIT